MRAAFRALVVVTLVLGAPAAARAKGRRGGSVSRTVVGEGTLDARLTTRPRRIVLGRAKQVILHVSAPEPKGPSRPLQASVNVGTLGAVHRTAPGHYEVAYTPPTKRFPQVAIVAVWRESGPKAPVAFFRVPLYGSARVPVQTVPRARVMVDLGGRRFGPFHASRRGHAVLKLVVPPGVYKATIVAVGRRHKHTTRSLELPVPPYNRLTLALVPHSIVADGSSEAELHLYYDAVGGRVPRPSDVHITAGVGNVGTVRHDKGPIFSATFTAPPGTHDQNVAFTARVAGDSVSVAHASVSVGRQRPARVSISVSPARFVADGTRGADVRVTFYDALGLGVPMLEPKLQAHFPGSGGRVTPMRGLGRGVYSGRLTPAMIGPEVKAPVDVPITVSAEGLVAHAKVSAEPWMPAKVSVTPASLQLSADGATTAVLRVTITDADGRVMKPITPRVSTDSGKVETPVRDGDAWQVRYTTPLIVTSTTENGGGGARDAVVHVGAGAIERTVTVHLTPMEHEVRRRLGFVELTGGYRMNLGRLAGPAGHLAIGADLAGTTGFAVSVGAVLGIGDAQGSLPFGAGVARVRVEAAPILGEVVLTLRRPSWLFELGAGAGVVLAPGNLTLPGTGDIKLSETVFAFGGRLGAGIHLGPGYVVLEASYIEADRSSSGGLEVTGPLAGAAVGLGYRLEL